LIEQGNHVTIFDDFSTGRKENIDHHRTNPRLRLVEGSILNLLELENVTEYFI
jgi:UDP-N-acetylglucosamine 4-epimerase